MKRAGEDRAAVDEYGWDVEARHGHHSAWERLVAAGNDDESVVAFGEYDCFYRVGDDLSRDEGASHAFGSH